MFPKKFWEAYFSALSTCAFSALKIIAGTKKSMEGEFKIIKRLELIVFLFFYGKTKLRRG
jgi:hypothetical protein